MYVCAHSKKRFHLCRLKINHTSDSIHAFILGSPVYMVSNKNISGAGLHGGSYTMDLSVPADIDRIYEFPTGELSYFFTQESRILEIA